MHASRAIIMKILIVDDDPVSRRVLRQILAADPSNEIVEAASGAEAWRTLGGPSHGFEAVFLDISMPELDGLELFKRMRGVPRLSTLPVILCTSSNDRATVIKAATVGARHYIVKPPSAPVVFMKLQQAISGTTTQAPFATA